MGVKKSWFTGLTLKEQQHDKKQFQCLISRVAGTLSFNNCFFEAIFVFIIRCVHPELQKASTRALKCCTPLSYLW